MSFKKKIFLGIIAAAACIAVWNISFPRIYSKIKYPKAKLLSSNTYNGSIYNGIMMPSDFGYRYAWLNLYDKEHDIKFQTNFELVWYFPFYIPTGPYDEFETFLDEKNKTKTMLYDMENITKRYTNDCTVVNNDTYGKYECHIFVKYLETEDFAALADELDDYVDKKSLTSINRNGYNIFYSLFVCMDDEIYDKCAAEEYSKGYGVFSHIPNLEHVRITASYKGFSAEIYENCGDPTDDEYQEPSSFDHLVFYYDSSPSHIRNKSQEFYLFGVNEKE